MKITTHLADDNDITKTACGIDMPVVNRANAKNVAVLCEDCRKVSLGLREDK